MFANATIAFALALSGWALAAEQAGAPFQHDAAVKLLGYDPETVSIVCKDSSYAAAPAAKEERVASYLRSAGEAAAAHAACPNAGAVPSVSFAKTGETLSEPVCRAAAAAAGGAITEHVSELMNTEHPDVVAAYVDGVAQALTPIRDACTASKETWAKVATQVLLFENRATNLRQGRTCALWRLSLDKELKAATATGNSKGRAAGLAYFQTRTNAALDGAHHYCAEDSTSSLIDANVGLTKMLLETLPDK